MSQDTIDTLKQPESNDTDFANFTDEQVDAVVVYLAKIARETLDKYGMTDEQKRANHKKFFALMDSWPADFRQRVRDRVINAAEEQKTNAFWIVPADAIIAATRAVEIGVEL
jgi:hypothetical protein